ncbi:MAG: Heme exporter protein B [Alphaproteobacteria bacterium MarineAlpha2_Bin1]|nr:MAG: Heme exporter protein B [Alphaproteobacteria bacterium MarineAlpha2_Bin1]|tara:strand:- start:624 stop:1292 length:669 start_codon:yes stop_codon:yes gene_type:complete
MFKIFLSIIKRDFKLSYRQGNTNLNIIVFFFLSISLFPLGVGPENELLSKIGPGIVWVSALFSSVLSLDKIFQADYEDGSLEIINLSVIPLEFFVLAKALSYWLTTGLLLVILSPIFGLILSMSSKGILYLTITMLLGTPTLILIGTIGASLAVSLKRGSLLISLLILPLYIPVLIFGVSAIDASINNVSAKPQLLLLGSLLCFSIVLSPIASAAGLRINME